MVYIKTYDKLSHSTSEILRYCGADKKTPHIEELIGECLDFLKNDNFNVCYGEFDIKVAKDGVDFGFKFFNSKTLAENLEGCEKAIIFGATLGMKVDRLLAEFSATSPLKALVMQGVPADMTESLCDRFEEDIKSGGFITTPRFSPGYGDFLFEYQRDIFAVLDFHKKIGLTLNDSLVMSPSKSVTAVMGIRENK